MLAHRTAWLFRNLPGGRLHRSIRAWSGGNPRGFKREGANPLLSEIQASINPRNFFPPLHVGTTICAWMGRSPPAAQLFGIHSHAALTKNTLGKTFRADH